MKTHTYKLLSKLIEKGDRDGYNKLLDLYAERNKPIVWPSWVLNTWVPAVMWVLFIGFVGLVVIGLYQAATYKRPVPAPPLPSELVIPAISAITPVLVVAILAVAAVLIVFAFAFVATYEREG